jgi:hypothetical protein
VKIERETYPANPKTIEEFADRHDLVMKVTDYGNGRVIASFIHTDVKDGCILCGVYGESSNEEGAIRDYANRISKKTIIVNAFGDDRKEIYVPDLCRSWRPKT